LPIADTQVRQAVRELAEKISEAIARTERIVRPTVEVSRLHDREFTQASERIFAEENTPQVDIKQKLILWVDDRPENNIFERKAMDKYGIKFVLAQSTNEALGEIEKLYKSSKSYFDAIISDMGRPSDPQAGYTLLESLRARAVSAVLESTGGGLGFPYLGYARLIAR
jgi:hypothetical protein